MSEFYWAYAVPISQFLYVTLFCMAALTMLVYAPSSIVAIRQRNWPRVEIAAGVAISWLAVGLNDLWYWEARAVAIELGRMSPPSLHPVVALIKFLGICAAVLHLRSALRARFREWSWAGPLLFSCSLAFLLG